MEFLEKIHSFFIQKNPKLTVFLLLTVFIACFYPQLLFHPGSHLLGSSGDSIKNYFAYEWHVHHDTSFVNYTGTNYPFGELHTYTDGNPLLSDLIKALPFLQSHSMAIFNLSLLVSILLTGLLLFAILRLCAVPHGFAILGALGIAILSPQTARMTAHFTLSYSFFIPLVMYLLLRSEMRENKRKYDWYLFFTVLLAFFVHPYMGMILASMIFLYQLVALLVKYRQTPSIILRLLIQVVLPLLLYLAFIRVTDTHSDRTTHPYGFFFYVASPESILVSSLPPFRHMLSQIIKIHEQNWEGQAYIGISSLFALLCSPFLLFAKRKSISEFIAKSPFAVVLTRLFFAAVLLLAFSMAYPFKWSEALLDLLPFVKQFRSPGRFAWVFYFVIATSSVILLSKYLFPRINPHLRVVLISLILLLYVVEGIPFHRAVAGSIVKNYFDAGLVDDELKQVNAVIKKMHPQAILPLPYFHFDTDYFCFNPTEKILSASFITAFHAGTPLFASCTPRTSLLEAKLSIQAMGSDLLKKELEKIISSPGPFCILYSKERLTEWEEAVLSKGRIILETENYVLKEISPATLLHSIIGDKRRFYIIHKNDLYFDHGLYLAERSFVRHISYDSLPRYMLVAKICDEYRLYEIPDETLEKDKQYEISFWYGLDGGDELGNAVIVEQINERGAVDTLAYKKCSQCPDIIRNRVLVTCNFTSRNPSKKIRIRLTGNKEGKGSFRLSDLLIRRKDVDVYWMQAISRVDSMLVLNNFELK